MRFSIIINNYNYARFLAEAIDSALSQTYLNVEVIVVDDGSIDGSREIIQSYGSRVIPIFKTNGGQASAFNEGFIKATGDIIYFLDADDTMDATLATTVVPLFLNKEVALVQFPLQVIGERGGANGSLFPHQKMFGDPVEQMLKNGFYIVPPTSGNVFRRQAVEQVFPIPENEYRLCADLYLVVTVPFGGKRVVLKDALANYRIHGQNNFMGFNKAEGMSRRFRQFNYLKLRIDLIRRVATRHQMKCSEMLYAKNIDMLYFWTLIRKIQPALLAPMGLSDIRMCICLLVSIFFDRMQPSWRRFKLWAKSIMILLAPTALLSVRLRSTNP